jgi:hypothetical protein
MTRTLYLLTFAAFVLVGLTTAFQIVDVPLAPGAALCFGALAGWQAARTARRDITPFRAGAVVGVGALLGAVLGLAVPAILIGSLPGVQAFVQASEPHPEARLPLDLIAPLAGVAGGLVGVILGVGDLLAAALGGLIAGALTRRPGPTGA